MTLLEKIINLDQRIQAKVAAWPRPKILFTAMWLIALSGYAGALWFAIALLATYRQNKPEIFVIMTIVQAVEYVIASLILKNIAKRKRPSRSFDDRIAEKFGIVSYSFPSGHASSSFAALVVLTFYFPCFWPLILSAAVLMTFSRLYLDKHYFSDIIAGVMIGLAAGLIGIIILPNLIHDFF